MPCRSTVLACVQSLLRVVLLLSLIAGACAGARLSVLMHAAGPSNGGPTLSRAETSSSTARVLRSLDMNGDGIPDALPPDAVLEPTWLPSASAEVVPEAPRWPASREIAPPRLPPRA